MGYKLLRLNTSSSEFSVDEMYTRINGFHEEQFGKYESPDTLVASEAIEGSMENEATELRTTDRAAAESTDVSEEVPNDFKDVSRLNEEAKKDLMSGCDQVRD